MVTIKQLCVTCVTGAIFCAVFFSGCAVVHHRTTPRGIAPVESLLTVPPKKGRVVQPGEMPQVESFSPADLVFSQDVQEHPVSDVRAPERLQTVEEKMLPPTEHISVQPQSLAQHRNGERSVESILPHSTVYDHYYIKVKTGGTTDGHMDEAHVVHFQWPVQGVVMCFFRGCGGEGVDIRVDPQASIYAAAAGKVVFAEENVAHYGKIIVMKHNYDWVTVYTRMKKILVKQGDVLKMGHCIATATDDRGNSAESIHFEIRNHGHAVDPSSLIQGFPRNR